MKICLIVEGAYPYISGGVSSWMVQLMKSMPQHEFVVQVITPKRTTEKKPFQCEIPGNLTKIEEVFLQDDDFVGEHRRKLKLSRKERKAIEDLMFGELEDWSILFEMFQNRTISLNDLLCGSDFFDMAKKYYLKHYKRIAWSDFLWTIRSMYLPLFIILKAKPMEADLYHSVSTGYAGMLGSMQACITGKKLLVTEHGIYTREREEEIIRAKWVHGIYKDLWIDQFKKLSLCAYHYAHKVVALFQEASFFQRELGCSPQKQLVIPNGVNVNIFADIPQKDPKDEAINLGAILRVTPIKDVKTMLSAYAIAKDENPRLKLWLMGPLDENPEYVEECRRQIAEMYIQDVIFTGKIQVKEYIGKMDVLLLTSLSEGQPLVILEGFAAKKPFICTNVGNCEGMLYGVNDADEIGSAGVIVPILGVNQIAKAMLTLAKDKDLRIQMGQNGYERAKKYFDVQETFEEYRKLYII